MRNKTSIGKIKAGKISKASKAVRAGRIDRVSVVVTVKNDEAGIVRLRKSLERQTMAPNEVIIVRAAPAVRSPLLPPPAGRRGVATADLSEDNEMKWKILFAGRDCTRGRGRNMGVRMAKNKLIAVTDVGCRPRKDWLEKLRSDLPRSDLPRSDLGKLVVAGWYRVAAKTELQKVMGRFLVPGEYYEESRACERRENKQYLPASRSIMFTRAAWELVGGYPEGAKSGGEDLEFARRLREHPEVELIQAPKAIVDWEPPASLGEFFRDIVKHTRGNVEVGYWPHLWRNLTVAGRWGIFLLFPWLIPAYLGIKAVSIMRQLPASAESSPIKRFFFAAAAQLAADAGVIIGLAGGLGGAVKRVEGIINL